MGAIQGDKYLIQIEDPNESGTYATLALQQGATLNFAVDEADITTKDSKGWHDGIVTIRTASLEGEGILDEGSTIGEFLEDMYFQRVARNMRVLTPSKRYDFLANLTDFSMDLPHDGPAAISFTFTNKGEVTRTTF